MKDLLKLFGGFAAILFVIILLIAAIVSPLWPFLVLAWIIKQAETPHWIKLFVIWVPVYWVSIMPLAIYAKIKSGK